MTILTSCWIITAYLGVLMSCITI